MHKIEYRVRPSTRFVVTRWESSDVEGVATASGSRECGEFDNEEWGYQVAYALARAEQEKRGWLDGDERMIYPTHPRDQVVTRIGEDGLQDCGGSPRG